MYYTLHAALCVCWTQKLDSYIFSIIFHRYSKKRWNKETKSDTYNYWILETFVLFNVKEIIEPGHEIGVFVKWIFLQDSVAWWTHQNLSQALKSPVTVGEGFATSHAIWSSVVVVEVFFFMWITPSLLRRSLKNKEWNKIVCEYHDIDLVCWDDICLDSPVNILWHNPVETHTDCSI